MSKTPALDAAIFATRQQVETTLNDHYLESIAELLPAFMEGQTKRIIARAAKYWADKPEIRDVTKASFVKCVLAAAELGFCLDGRMAYAVPRKVKQPNGSWKKEAVFQSDYKALIAVAKRGGLIQDCWSRLVMPTDTVAIRETDGVTKYTFEPDLTIRRDNYEQSVGVLSVVTNKGGWYRVEYMHRDDVEAIRNQYSKATGDHSPWNTNPGEMAKKTGLRRILKTFTDDPGLLRLMDLEDEAGTAERSLEAAGLDIKEIRRKLAIPPVEEAPVEEVEQVEVEAMKEAP
jgi:phage RecT family recombinase